MLLLTIALVLLIVLLLLVFLGGVSVGLSESPPAHDRLTSARLRALEAERRLHDLTRETFVRITEAAERRRHPD